ncbi:ferredoxin [candidate division WWE3 bacterium]|nr:ferredoxin [candidate division WWE3 bacterium]
MKRIKITIIRELCIGVGTCVVQAPGTFELDSENIAVIKNENGDSLVSIIEAAKSCPTLAIYLNDADTGEQIWPEV